MREVMSDVDVIFASVRCKSSEIKSIFEPSPNKVCSASGLQNLRANGQNRIRSIKETILVTLE